MRFPKAWKRISGWFIPPRGRSERQRFSLGERPTPGSEGPKTSSGQEEKKKGLSSNLDENVKELKKVFHVPQSTDVVFREFFCAMPKVKVEAAYIEGLANFDKVFLSVLQPLMLLSSIQKPQSKAPVEQIKDALIANGQVVEKESLQDLIDSMITGDTVVLIEGQKKALAVETKGWEHRSVEQTVTERIVRGPQQGFGEVLRINTALLRSILHTPDLVVETLDIGQTSKNQVAIAYLANVANSKLVEEVKRRLKNIKVDALISSGRLEQLLEGHHSLVPTVLSTERPDRAAAFILEGALAIMVAGDPFILLAPVTVFAFIHSPEDYYVRYPFGNILRGIRIAGLLITVLLPGLYVAIINYHPEMVPTILLMAIAASREMVPFPLPFEVLLMYFGFELIREAGIRIPSPIGPTIGIVGALLIGEAAVSASLVSPIMVIVIAVTGVASFTVPNQEAGMLVRVITLVFIIAGSVMGLFGIVALLYAFLCHIFSLTSLGVPMFAPMAPRRSRNQDVLGVGPTWKMELRPSFLRPKEIRRQPEISRQWDLASSGNRNNGQTEGQANTGKQDAGQKKGKSSSAKKEDKNGNSQATKQ